MKSLFSDRTLIAETPQKIGQKVRLFGWVNSVRDHGKLVFVDLRDQSGVVQIVGAKEVLGRLKNEFVVCLEGEVKKPCLKWQTIVIPLAHVLMMR